MWHFLAAWWAKRVIWYCANNFNLSTNKTTIPVLPTFWPSHCTDWANRLLIFRLSQICAVQVANQNVHQVTLTDLLYYTYLPNTVHCVYSSVSQTTGGIQCCMGHGIVPWATVAPTTRSKMYENLTWQMESIFRLRSCLLTWIFGSWCRKVIESW